MLFDVININGLAYKNVIVENIGIEVLNFYLA